VAALKTILNRGLRPISLALAAATILALGTGCRTKALTDPIIGPNYQVSNVFRKDTVLPAQVRRVAVLPLSYRESSALLVSGKDSLQPVLASELIKASRFETFFIEPAQLKQWTGREHWDAYEALPSNLFKLLVEKTGANAILFATLSEYKPYPPMAIGWRMKLVGTDAETLWAIEEIFDASQVAVSNSARRYDRDHVRSNPALEDSRSVLLSPTRFGKYTLDVVLKTLPNR
jgi:hypothetical protein